MPETYTDPTEDFDRFVVSGVEKPRRPTHPNKIKFQPDDADWSLDRLTELQEAYRAEFGKPLPVVNKGQGTVHNRMGWDHRGSSDVGLHPTSREGQRFQEMLRERKVPFLAFTGPVPGASTGPHFHIGRPSARTAAKYPVGTQARLTRKAVAQQSDDDFERFVVPDDSEGSDDFDSFVTAAAEPARTSSRFGAPAGPRQPLRQGKRTLAQLAQGGAAEGGPPPSGRFANLPNIYDILDQATHTTPRTFGEDVAARAAEKQAQSKIRGQIKFPGEDAPEYKAFLLQNRAVDSPTMRRQFVDLGVKQRTAPAGGSSRLTLALQQAEEARQQRVAQLSTVERAAQIPKSIATGAASAVGSHLKGMAALSKKTDIFGILDDREVTDVSTYKLGEFIASEVPALLGSNPDLERELAVGKAPATLGQVGVFMLGGWAAKAPKLAVAIMGGGMVAGDAYDEVRANGGTDEEATNAALLAGGLLGPTELIGMRGALKALKGTAAEATWKEAARTALREGRRDALENSLQEMGQEFGQGLITGDIRTVGQLGEAGLLGAFAGGVGTAAVTAARTAPKIALRDRFPAGTETQDIETALKDPTTPLPQAVEEAPEAQTPLTPAPSPAVEAAVVPGEAAAVGPTAGETLPAERRAEPRTPEGDLDWATNLAESRGGSIEPDGAGFIVRMGDEAVSVRSIPEAVATVRELDTKLDLLGQPREEIPLAPAPTTVPLPETAPVTPPPTSVEETAEVGEKRLPIDPVLDNWPVNIQSNQKQLQALEEEKPRHQREQELRDRIKQEMVPGDYVLRNGRRFRIFSDGNSRPIDGKGGSTRLDPLDMAGARLISEPSTSSLAPKKSIAALMAERAESGPPTVRETREEIQRTMTKAQILDELGTNVRMGDYRNKQTKETLARELAKRRVEQQRAEAGPIPLHGQRPGEAGFIDIGELRDGIKAGVVKVADAVEQLRAKFPTANDGELRAMLGDDVAEPPAHHAALQPRTPEGKFDGPPLSGPAADRELIRQAGQEYHREYNSLFQHQARREGLAVVNDDVATNYFNRLHRFVRKNEPDKLAMIDQAEVLYSRGKFADATLLTERALAGSHEYPNRLNTAATAIQLEEYGVDLESDIFTRWKDTMREVKARMARTGPLSGGGSTFYDVNKYPEGGRPDHSKIAYILEPVIDMLRADAQRLIAEGKLRTEDLINHIRMEVNKLMSGEDFADWHPLNKSAALGVLVDHFKRGGVPPPPPDAPKAAADTDQPRTKKRSLPKTREKSGRDPGTNLTYEVIPGVKAIAAAEKRIADLGVDAAEALYRVAPPSAERTDAVRLIGDHLQAQAVQAADAGNTEEAYALIRRAKSLNSIEDVRATEMGQAIQAYSRYLKFTPAGVMREAASLAAKGFPVPPKQFVELSRLAGEVQSQQQKVDAAREAIGVLDAEESGEGGGPGGTGARRTSTRRRPVKSREVLTAEEKEARKRRDAAKRAIARQLDAIQQSRTLVGYYKRSLNIVRGLMVSQLSTAMRNLQSQIVRFELERLTDLVEHTLRSASGLESDFNTRTIFRNVLRIGKANQESYSREILSGHPEQLSKMYNTHAEAAEIVTESDWRNIEGRTARNIERVFGTAEKATEVVNFFNRLQEFHLRSAEFLAELDLHMRREKGTTLEKFVKRQGIDAIPEELIDRAVQKALEVTFSDMPPKDRAGGRLISSMIEVGNYIPPTLSPAAFPRFMYNSLKFLYQYNPIGGLIDTGVIAARNRSITKKTARLAADDSMEDAAKAKAIAKLEEGRGNVPRAMARQLVGTALFLIAHQFRNSDWAGEKWYEIRIGDTTVDARPFGPFSTYLFLAEIVRRAQHGQKPFTVQELAQALGATTTPGGVGMGLAEKLYENIAGWMSGDERAFDKLQRIIKTEGGEFGRALLTPVRQVKDLVAAFDAEEAIIRETSGSPFLGPIQESIPGLSRSLPAAHQPTTAAPIRQERPLTKQLTGWRVQTPKTFLQRQLDELNFTFQEIKPGSGVPEIDALEERIIGPMMDQLSAELEKDEAFKAMSKAQRASTLGEILKDVREDARTLGKAEKPELYEQMEEVRKPRRQRELEREQATPSPGISRAQQLGVPLPVPPRQPSEDDLAYRARLIQFGRAQRAALDAVTTEPGFYTASSAQQRKALYTALQT